ncbi:MAG: LacI family transcriptional regulator [Bacilli bacterium]|jgi:DNA-binding LacI/PurR family transcriptional regulator|nr:LacI family transcriptional regulator [Bacilli bacterium]
MKKKSVSINDVAKAAGVTKSTISNVFSSRAFVSPELKAKVLRTAKKLDYTPGFYAVGLSGKKDDSIIGLFLESNHNVYLNYFDTLVGAVLRVASQRKKKVLVFIGLSNDEFLKCLKAKSTPIAGAILVNPTFDDARIKQLKKDELPCVTIGKPMFAAPRRLKYVDVDNEGLVMVVTRLMEEAGHSKIAFLHVTESMTLGRIQRQAFCQALDKSEGLTYPLRTADADEGYEVAKKAIRSGASAIICATPNSAKGAYQAIKESGKRVGKDIAVFSLGPASKNEKAFRPSLSYASQNYAKLGEAASKILIAMVDHERTRSHLVIKSKLTFGDSFVANRKQ